MIDLAILLPINTFRCIVRALSWIIAFIVRKVQLSDRCSKAKPFHSKSNSRVATNLPWCFVCSSPECRHFLIDCEKFMAFSPMNKRQCVVDVKRCLNCLSLNHFVRDCKGPSKCGKCGPNSHHKHTSAFHKCFDVGNFGVAEALDSKQTQARKQKTDQIDKRNLVVQKIGSFHKNTIFPAPALLKF